MEEQSQDLKKPLAQPSGELDELNELIVKHHELEGRLHELTERPYLSQPEQLEEVTLKKRKLQIKDRIEALRRQMGSSFQGAHP